MNSITPKLLEAEKLNYRFYDFTATMITDKIYNIFVDNWKIIYRNVISPALTVAASSNKSQDKFTNFLLNALFQNGKFNIVLFQWRVSIFVVVLLIKKQFESFRIISLTVFYIYLPMLP